MTKAIIIEDEQFAGNALAHTLAEIGDGIQVEVMLDSVTAGIKYLSASPEIDIIFSDVQLKDGLSFEIFKVTEVKTPVIFTTAYDEFMVNAFAFNGIAYLLKPVERKEIEMALHKYRMFENHFSSHHEAMRRFTRQFETHKKNRLVVKRGIEYISLRLDDIILFYTENKLVYVMDNCGKRYIAEKTLGELEAMLDSQQFFRANRQYIINIEYIRGFKVFERVKLQVILNDSELSHSIIVSQENAYQFRRWMLNA
jgi:DNA-binding LytR/AlgR family response regulator